MDDQLLEGDVRDEDAIAGTAPPIHLRAPGGIDHVGRQDQSYWLGFRIAPSNWPGYLRVSFASDLNFNAATLDIHHSEFGRLKDGIERFAGGQCAGINLNTPAEFMTPRYRKVIGVILLQPEPPLGRVQLLDLDFEPVATISAYHPDMVAGIASIPQHFGAVFEAPPRRALRRLDAPLADQVPDGWLFGLPQGEPLAEIRERFDGKYAEVRIALQNATARIRGELTEALEVDFDFADWPAVVSIETRRPDGSRNTEVAMLDWPDIRAMREHVEDQMLRVRSMGHLEVEVPRADRPNLLNTLETYFLKAEEALAAQMRNLRTRALNRYVREKLEEIQMSFPFDASRAAGSTPGEVPVLTAPEQADLFRPGSSPDPVDARAPRA